MARIVQTLLAELPARGLCLEIGVGTGRIALPLIRAGRLVVGVDISLEMMRRLVDNAAGSPPPLVAGDATRLPFRDRSFTSAIASHVLHLIPAWHLAVDELLRVMAPGGGLVATRGRRHADDWSAKVSRHFFAEAGDPPWPPGVDQIGRAHV
jgi:ubiquinone/menaquinone biosynthesis C-methylase UbiE